MGDERPHDLRGSTVAGARVDRVLRRPHEIRVYLRGADPRRSVWLHFWPATEASVDVLAPDREATHLTTGPGTRVRVRAGDAIVVEADAPEWSWHPYDAAEDEHLWQLDDEEREAVRRAVAALAARDPEALRPFTPDPEPFLAEGGQLAPPGPVEDWEGAVLRHADGTVEVDVELFDADEPGTLTDLTLQMELTRAADGTVVPLLRDLHML